MLLKKISLTIFTLAALSASTHSFCMLKKLTKIAPAIKTFCTLKQVSYNFSKKPVCTPFYDIIDFEKLYYKKSNSKYSHPIFNENVQKYEMTQGEIEQKSKEPTELQHHDLALLKHNNLNEDNSKLFDACFKNNLEDLKKLLAESPAGTINTLCTEEWKNYIVAWPFYSERSLLWLACAMGHGEIVEWLLLNGAKIGDEKSLQELLSINCDRRFCKSESKIKKNKATIEKLLKKHKNII